MRPPVSNCLYAQVDQRRATAAVPTTWEARGLRIQLAETAEPVRWGSTLMGVRRTGRWSRRRDGGGCTLDLAPAGTGRTLVVLTLQPSPRRLAAVGAEVCWWALVQLRAGLEADVLPPTRAVHVPATARPIHPPAGQPAPTAPVASGILPA